MELVRERLVARNKEVERIASLVEHLSSYAERLTGCEARAVQLARENKLLRFEMARSMSPSPSMSGEAPSPSPKPAQHQATTRPSPLH